MSGWLARLASPVRRFLTRTIRRQLMFGIALVHAVLMTVFVYDLVARQRAFLHKQKIAEARGAAEMLAASSVSWVVADDVIGLEETVRSVSVFPEVRYAMVISPQGKVLGHTDPKKTGQYLADPISLAKLGAEAKAQIVVADQRAIDVAAPIMAKGKLVGWARVGLSEEQSAASLFAVTRNGLLYTLLAIATGMVFAWYMARGLNRGLNELVQVADGVRSGQRHLRSKSARQDELGQLGADLNLMLDTMDRDQRRQAMEHAVVRLLADAPCVARAMPDIIRTICETMDWDCGLHWRWDAGDERLRCAAHWSREPGRTEEFVGASCRTALSPTRDVGLVRRAFASGEPLWIADVTADAGFMRAPLAARAGLHGAFTFPIGSRNAPMGAMEFFCREIRPPDETLLEIARAMGIQIGQFIAHKEADAARAEGERQIQLLLESVAEAIYGVDLNGRCTFVNPACLRTLGYAVADELLGKNIHELIHHTYADGTAYPAGECRIYRAYHRNEAVHVEDEVFWRRDGTSFPVEYWSHPILRDGQVVGAVATFFDITERKRLEQALRASEDLVREAQESAHIGNFQFNPATGAVEGSDELFRIFGLTRDQSDFNDFIALIDASQREFVTATIVSAIANNSRYDIEHYILPHDGSRKYVRAIGTASVGANGTTRSIVGTIQDVTARKIAEEHLRKLSMAVDQSSESIVITDLKGRIEYANKAFVIATGYSLEEAIGQNPRILQSGKTPRDVYADMWAHLNRGEGWQGEFTNRRKNGEEYVEWVRMTPVRQADGRITHFMAIKEDITERKRTDAERLHLETQLRESQKMEALGTLAGGVAHDFNNALATIIGNVDLAGKDMGPSHPARVSLEEIRKASSRAKALVQQILAFGRRQPLARKVILLAPAVEEAVSLLRATLPAGVSLSVDCAPDAPPVLADALHVEQALLNLCSNAWHAVKRQERAGIIEVRLEAHDQPAGAARDANPAMIGGDPPPGRYARITVRDNGQGMDEKTRARIFEPFFTTKPVGEGTGLGLAVVHGIVREHDARIEVRSAPGEGSTFAIYFPAARISDSLTSEPDPRAAPGTRGAAQELPVECRRIVYIDDDESIVFLMTRLLERKGYQVSGYTDAREALAVVRGNPDQFDLVVTDYNMPGMSGLDVANTLRQIRADLPVALASGYITDELRAKAPAAGVRELIYKPNTVDEFCEAVARLANARVVTENS